MAEKVFHGVYRATWIVKDLVVVIALLVPHLDNANRNENGYVNFTKCVKFCEKLAVISCGPTIALEKFDPNRRKLPLKESYKRHMTPENETKVLGRIESVSFKTPFKEDPDRK